MTSSYLAGPLLTDLYEMTMAAGYWRHNLNDKATFSVFVRNPDQNRNYFVAAGLATLLAELEAYRFRQEDIHYLQQLKLFDANFLDALRRLRFTGDIHAGDGSDGTANTLDCTAYSTGITVDLSSETATVVTGDLTKFQNVIGGASGDTITGDSQDNVIIGGPGTDVLDGGSGMVL